MAKSAPVEDQDTVENDEQDTEEQDEELAGNVLAHANEDAQADAEGRDRSDVNELQSRVDAQRLVQTNMGDEEMNRTAVEAAQRKQQYGKEPKEGPELNEKDKKAAKALDRFASLSKVKKGDILAFNPDTYIGVTGQGSKLQMNRKGTQLRHLAGPVPDGLVAEADQREQDRLEREANRE